MHLIIDIFRWFLYGSNGHPGQPENFVSERPALEKEAISVLPQRKSNGIDFDLNRGANLEHFIADMKSIEPISKQFSRAREELLEELKKLTPRKIRK